MIKSFFSSQLCINIASGVVVTVINAVVMIVVFPVYLHFLGYETYGVWLVLATVLNFAQLGNLGINQAVMKLVAEEHGCGDIEGIQRYVTTALALLCLSGSLVLIVVLVFKTQIIGVFKLTGENAKMVSWLLPYMGCLSIYVFIVQALNATLSGLGRMDLANYIQSIGRIVAVVVASILLYIGRGIESLLIGNIFSCLFIHVVSIICIWRIARVHFLRIDNLDTQYGKRLLRFGGGIFGGTLVSMLGGPFHKLMLSRYAGISTLPIYEIAFRGSLQFRGLIEAGFRAFVPESSRVTAVITPQNIDRMTMLHRRAMKSIIVFGFPMYVAMLIFAAPLLIIWLREEFIQTIPSAFRIVLVATFISLLGVPSSNLLLGMGRIRTFFAARCITWLTSMALVLVIAVNTNRLSVNTIGLCSIISWSLSSTHLIWRFRSVMRDYAGRVSETKGLWLDAINR